MLLFLPCDKNIYINCNNKYFKLDKIRWFTNILHLFLDYLGDCATRKLTAVKIIGANQIRLQKKTFSMLICVYIMQYAMHSVKGNLGVSLAI